MTEGPLEFTLARNANPASDEVRADILARPGIRPLPHRPHGVDRLHRGPGWHDAAVLPYGPIELDPSAIVLHYAQEVFEGLKAYRWADGSIVSFRPEANAARLRTSARRLAIPELPEEVFIESLRQLIAVDGDWVPAAGGEESLYLRPFIFATEPGLGVRPANEYRYMVIASPGGRVLQGRHQAGVRVAVHRVRAGQPRRHRRGQVRRQLRRVAAGAGRGRRARLRPGGLARRHRTPLRRGDGRHEPVLRLRQRRHRRGWSPRSCSGSLLPGITRDSLLQLATDAGFAVEERKIDVDEWQKKAAAGEITEVFACGTAAVITPVSHVKSGDGEFTIADGEPGEVTMALRDTLTGIQRGTFADTHGWMTRLG